MLNTERTDKATIESSVEEDLANRNAKEIESLKLFYYNIIVEQEIRTSSFRYKYARTALLYIATKYDDKDTVANLRSYHRDKVQYEIKNPVKKSDVELIPNQVTKAQKYGNTKISKNATQIKL